MALIVPVIGRTLKRKVLNFKGMKTPVIAGHKLLYSCNLKCDMCPFWYFESLINSWYFNKKWTCKPWLTINIDPEGRIVTPCYVINEYSGSTRVWETDIMKLWNEYKWENYESCNACSLSCYLEPSIFSWRKPSLVNERILGGISSYISSMI